MNGEHLWLETNVSGDLCYLGEENCQVRFAVSMSHGAHLVFRGNSGCLQMAGMEGEWFPDSPGWAWKGSILMAETFPLAFKDYSLSIKFP